MYTNIGFHWNKMNKTQDVYSQMGREGLSHRYDETNYLWPSYLNPQMGDRTRKTWGKTWKTWMNECNLSQRQTSYDE